VNLADDKEMGRYLVLARQIKPGERVHYRCWRGGEGQGIFLRFINPENREYTNPNLWGHHAKDGMVIKRDFSADDGRVFRPFLKDGDMVLSDLMIAEKIMES
jgi:hypothetical protein